MKASRHYMQDLERNITKVLRSVAADQAKARGSNKISKVRGYRFPKHANPFRMDNS